MKLFRGFFGFLIGSFVLILCLINRTYDPAITSTLRGAGFDTLQAIWPRSPLPAQPIRVVDIDEISLKAIGQWPWPRDELAKLVTKLTELGASAIAFDIIFAEPDRLSPSRINNDKTQRDNDVLLADAIKNGPVVTAFASTSGQASLSPPQLKAGFAQTGMSAQFAPMRLNRVVSNLAELDAAAKGVGSMNIDLAQDQGIARQIPLIWTDGKTFYPSLVLEALRVAQGADTFVLNGSQKFEDALESIRVGGIEIPTSDTGMLNVRFGYNDPTLYVSAVKVLSEPMNDALRQSIAGHIVLIGTSAVGLLDMRTSALGEDIPGVSIHAQALEQILSGDFLSRPSWIIALEYLLTVGLALLLSIITMFWRPVLTFAAMISTLLALAGLTAVLFRSYGLQFDFTFPAVTLILAFLSTIAFKLLVTDREGRQLRRVFGHYVAPEILAEIERNPNHLKLGGETREITVMFVDIQNFTPLSEKLNPQELVKFVNGVMEVCSAAILSEGGTIDKYIGDAVMAFWNAPVTIENHQYHACSAALEITKSVDAYNSLDDVKSDLSAIGSWPIKVRIGMATGPAVVGNMGSQERFDYSAIGEAVNTAARAETACKLIGHNIILAGRVQKKTYDLALVAAGDVPMRGKAHHTPVHAVFGTSELARSSNFMKFKTAFEAVLQNSNVKNVKGLVQQFSEYKIFIESVFQKHRA